MVTYIFCCLSSIIFLCATGTETGKEPGYWDNHSVVYGEIDNTSILESGKTCRLTFRPKVTLRGTFDSSMHETIHPTYSIAKSGGGMLGLPEQFGKTVVIVLKQESDKWIIPSAMIAFIPNGRAIYSIKGLHDPELEKVFDLLKHSYPLNQKFRCQVFVGLKDKAKDRGITEKQIEDRITSSIAKSSTFLISEIYQLPFSDSDPTQIRELATIDFQFTTATRE